MSLMFRLRNKTTMHTFIWHLFPHLWQLSWLHLATEYVSADFDRHLFIKGKVNRFQTCNAQRSWRRGSPLLCREGDFIPHHASLEPSTLCPNTCHQTRAPSLWTECKRLRLARGDICCVCFVMFTLLCLLSCVDPLHCVLTHTLALSLERALKWSPAILPSFNSMSRGWGEVHIRTRLHARSPK